MKTFTVVVGSQQVGEDPETAVPAAEASTRASASQCSPAPPSPPPTAVSVVRRLCPGATEGGGPELEGLRTTHWLHPRVTYDEEPVAERGGHGAGGGQWADTDKQPTRAAPSH